jgi:hypothetical protein
MANIARQDQWDRSVGGEDERDEMVGQVWVGRVVGRRLPGFGKILPGKCQQTKGGKSVAGSEDDRGF